MNLPQNIIDAIEQEVANPAPDCPLCSCGLRELLTKGAEIALQEVLSEMARDQAPKPSKWEEHITKLEKEQNQRLHDTRNS